MRRTFHTKWRLSFQAAYCNRESFKTSTHSPTCTDNQAVRGTAKIICPTVRTVRYTSAAKRASPLFNIYLRVRVFSSITFTRPILTYWQDPRQPRRQVPWSGSQFTKRIPLSKISADISVIAARACMSCAQVKHFRSTFFPLQSHVRINSEYCRRREAVYANGKVKRSSCDRLALPRAATARVP